MYSTVVHAIITAKRWNVLPLFLNLLPYFFFFIFSAFTIVVTRAVDAQHTLLAQEAVCVCVVGGYSHR